MRRRLGDLTALKDARIPADVNAAIARYRGTPVYVPWPGKTLFENFRRFELDLRRELPPDGLGHGAIVVSFPHSTVSRRLAEVFAELQGVWTENLRQAAAEGRIRIVLDESPEGYPPSATILEAVHRGLESLAVPVEAAVVVTQDRGYAAEYAQYRKTEGIESSLRVLNYDYWIRRFHRQFERRGPDVLAARLDAFKAKPKARGRRFVSLNMSLRPTKVLFLLSVIRDGLWEQGYISCGGLFKRPGLFDDPEERKLSKRYFATRIAALGSFDGLAKEVLPFFFDLQRKGQIFLGNVEREGPNGLSKGTPIDPLLREYDDSWFTAVTDTEMRPRRSRITEKPFGALVNFHPLVIFGNPGALAELRGLGYATFEEALDESYDEIDDPGRRFAAAYGEFARLCRMDEGELALLEDRLREVLTFNAEWGLVRLPPIYRDRIDLTFLDQLFDGGRSP